MEFDSACETAREALARSICLLHIETLGLDNLASQKFREAVRTRDRETLENSPVPFLAEADAPCHNAAEFLERSAQSKGASVEGCEDSFFGALSDQAGQALEAWDREIENGPDNTSEAYCKRGRMLMLLGAHADAAKSFVKALEIAPLALDAYAGLCDTGWTRWNQKKKLALDAYAGLGDCYLELDRPVDAAETFKRALRLEPASEFFLLGLYLAYENRGQSDAAVTELKKALAAAPEEPGPRLALGFAYEGMGEYDSALRLFREVMRLDPKSVYAHVALAQAYSRSGRSDDAAIVLEQAALCSCRDAAQLELLADELMRSGQKDRALAVHRRVEHADLQDSRISLVLLRKGNIGVEGPCAPQTGDYHVL